MNEQQERLLEIYRGQWERLNALNALRADIEAEVKDLHARQRQLANKIAALGTIPGGEGKPEVPEIPWNQLSRLQGKSAP